MEMEMEREEREFCSGDERHTQWILALVTRAYTHTHTYTRSHI